MGTGHVLITGASGFIGKACVYEFLSKGWRVTAVINRTKPEDFDRLRERADFDMINVSLADKKNLLSEISKVHEHQPVTCIFHAAGRAADIGSEKEFREVNFTSTANLADATGELQIAKLIYVSTTDVYGIKDFSDADENTELDNNLKNFYPHFKILSEKYIREHLPPSKYVIIRPAAVWGPGDNTILPRVAGFLGKSPFIVNFGKWKGRNRWPLAYVGNLAKAVHRAASCEDANGNAINIIDSEWTTFEEYQRIVLDIFFPAKRNMKAVNIPDFPAVYIARLSTFVSNLFNLKKPVWEPTFYGYRSIAANLDFSNRRMKELIESNGDKMITKEKALEDVKAYYSGFHLSRK